MPWFCRAPHRSPQPCSGRIFLGERLAPPTLVAIVAAVGGVAMMFASALGSGDLAGNMLALGVAILFGANIVVVRAARGLDLVPATVLAGTIALLATLPRATLGAPSAYDFALLAAMGTSAAWASVSFCSCAGPRI